MVYLVLIAIALAFGLVEGISEWLPISSTGHMILLEGFFQAADYDIPEKLGFSHGAEFFSMFLVVIQLGAILAVVVYFWNSLWPWSKKKLNEDEAEFVAKGYREGVIQASKRRKIYQTWGKTIVGVLPAAVVGLVFEFAGLDAKMENWVTVSVTLIVYGVLFILLERFLKGKKDFARVQSVDDLSYKTAFYVGCFQILALIPGTSRSGVTILGALLLGCSRSAAAEFSFFLSIPVMVGASGLKLVSFFMDSGMPNLNEWLFLLIGMVSAFLISLLAVKWLMGFVKKHTFTLFGYYRIALGLIVIAFFATMVGLGRMSAF